MTKVRQKNSIIFGFSFELHYLCKQSNIKLGNMSIQAMTQLIAEYFKTGCVLKVRFIDSYAREDQRADSDADIQILPDKSQHSSLSVRNS